jgi:peptide/nickel transport system substrate-binding protein
LRRFLAFLLVMSVVVALAAGCGGQTQSPPPEEDEETAEEPAGGPKAGGTVVWAHGHDAAYIDPGYAYTGEDIDPTVLIFETLLNYEFAPDGGVTYSPNLATEWSQSGDGLEWTFNLRDGVKFHDGTDFNADAVVFSFKRLYDETHPYFIEGRWSYFDDLLGDVLEDVIAEDEHTVKIVLKRPFAPLLTYLGYYSESVVSPAAVEKYGEDFFKNPVGTGPFKLEEWRKDDRIVLVPFEGYWGDKPYLERVILRVVPEVSTRLAEMETGGVHIFQSPPSEQIPRIKANPQLEVGSFPAAQLAYVAINNDTVTDVRLRQAIAHAVDWDKIVEVIWGELGYRASSILPGGVLGSHPGLKPYEFDQEKAKDLLAQAGIPQGYQLTMIAPNAPRWSHPDPITGLEMVQNDLKAVGIDVVAKPLEMGAWSAATTAGEYDLAWAGWMDVPDPNNFLHTLLVVYGGTRWRYQNEEVTDLAIKGASTYDNSERASYYKQLQEIVYSEVPAIPVAYGNAVYAHVANLKGFNVGADGILRLHRAYLE